VEVEADVVGAGCDGHRRVLSPGHAAYLHSRPAQRRQLLGRVCGAHERRAHEHGVGVQPDDVGQAGDARLAHHQAVGGNQRLESQRGLQIHLKIAQIPVVDPDDGRVGGQGFFQLRLGVHLHQAIHAKTGGDADETPQVRRRQQRGDEEHGVGAQRPRLQNLGLVNDEILAQHRQHRDRLHPPDIRRVATEEAAIGDHRYGRGVAVVLHRQFTD